MPPVNASIPRNPMASALRRHGIRFHEMSINCFGAKTLTMSPIHLETHGSTVHSLFKPLVHVRWRLLKVKTRLSVAVRVKNMGDDCFYDASDAAFRRI